MGKAGGIIALIAGIFGILAAAATLMIGGIGGAFEAEGSTAVVGLGWGGIIFSFLIIILGAVCISNPTSKKMGIALIIVSILGIFLGGTLVAVFMVLSLIGGILVILEYRKSITK